jgi:uroporphyrinogen-III synthase
MSKLTLRDRLVVLTRPEGRGADWKQALVEAGAAVSELPLLEITFEPDDAVLGEVLDAMGEYDWIVFTSANGVRGFFDRFFERFTDIRSVGGVRFACLGPATEKALRQYHLDSDLTATQEQRPLPRPQLMDKHDVENQKVLVVTGNLNTPNCRASSPTARWRSSTSSRSTPPRRSPSPNRPKPPSSAAAAPT